MAKQNFDDLMSMIDDALRSGSGKVEPGPETEESSSAAEKLHVSRHAKLGVALAQYFGSTDTKNLGRSKTNAVSRVKEVITDERAAKVLGEFGTSEHRFNRAHRLLLNPIIDAAIQSFLDDPSGDDAPIGVDGVITQFALLAQGRLYGFGPGDDELYASDRRATLTSPLRFILVGAIGSAAAEAVGPMVANSRLLPTDVQREFALAGQTVWRPRPATVAAAAFNNFIIGLLKSRGISASAAAFGTPAFSEELRMWVADGFGQLALTNALRRVVELRDMSRAEREGVVQQLTKKLTSHCQKADPDWLTGEKSDVADLTNGKSWGDAAVNIVDAKLSRYRRQSSRQL